MASRAASAVPEGRVCNDRQLQNYVGSRLPDRDAAVSMLGEHLTYWTLVQLTFTTDRPANCSNHDQNCRNHSEGSGE
jgi:hypothetical protein